jgi:GT2 family glycosyltransferase
VEFIQGDENVGFARANNMAFQRSSGDLVLFLNPDTTLEFNTLHSIVDYMSRLPKAGALGCRLLNEDGSLQYYCVQRFPSLIGQIFENKYLKRISLRRYHNSSKPGPIPVDCISGACMLVKRDVFEGVGKFSEEYFMYSEDVDLCRKIWDAGFEVAYIKDVSIVHYEGKSSEKKDAETSSFTSVMMVESRYNYFFKFRGLMYAKFFRYLIMVESSIRLMVLKLLQVLTKKAKQAMIQEQIRKWKSIMEWSLGMR